MSTFRKILSSLLIFGTAGAIAYSVPVINAFDFHIFGITGWVAFALIYFALTVTTAFARVSLFRTIGIEKGRLETFFSGYVFGGVLVATFWIMASVLPNLLTVKSGFGGALLGVLIGIACGLDDVFGFRQSSTDFKPSAS